MQSTAPPRGPADPTPMRNPPDPPLDLFGRALDSVADAVIICDLGQRVVYWNAAAEALYGYSAAEARQQHLQELVVPVHVKAEGQDVLSRVERGDAYQGEWLMKHRDGHHFPVYASTSVVLDAAGVPCNFIGVSRDATAHKAAFQTAQTLAGIVANSGDGILTCDRDGVIVWCNPQVERIYGWTAAELVGRHQSILVEESGRLAQDALWRRVLSGEQVQPVKVARRRRDGTFVEVSLALAAMRDEEGRVTGTSAIIRDLTVENELRRNLERQAEDLRARFEQASTPQTLMDLSGNFLSVNDAFCALMGWPREDLLQMSRVSIAHVSDSGVGNAAVELLLSGREKSVSFEKLLRHRDGHAIPVLIDVTMLHDEAGTAFAMASFVRDLTTISTAEERLAKQQALYRALNRRASDVSFVTDADLVVRYVSPSVRQIFGYTPDEPVGQTLYDFVHPDDLETLRTATERVVATPDGSERILIRARTSAGDWLWIEESLTNCLHDPDIRGIIGNLRDVTAQVRTQEQLRRSEARYRAIAETAQEGIVVFKPTGEVIFLNQKLAELLGHPLDDLVNGVPQDIFDAETSVQLRHKLLNRAELGPESYEVRYHHPDGTDHTLVFSVSPLPLPEDEGVGSLAMVSDITNARRAESELRRRVVHDALTNLPNRVLLADRIQVALERQTLTGTGSVALMFLDLDHFKLVNDSRGHAAGDQLLIEIGQRIQHTVRPGDTVARLGGDEFAVLCEDVDEALALVIASRLRECLSSPVELGGPRVYVDASIGVALSPPHDAEALLRYADVAMYEAKAAGRGRIRVFDATLADNADRRLQVMNALREALDADQLSLHYQPMVDIDTGRVNGMEALLRWTDPQLGPVTAMEVVGAADAMGLSLTLDKWVLHRACAEMAELRRQGRHVNARLSVNVSARSFAVPGLDEIVATVLADTGWPARQLVLEVTESAIMTDAPCAVALLTKLRDQNVAIAIDDFGTGYSSLAYLKRLPVSILKIDRSFVDQVTVDSDSRAIARSVVDLATALGLRAVAEGIETAEQAAVMVGLGCSRGQGYLWSPAIPAAELMNINSFRRDGSVRD